MLRKEATRAVHLELDDTPLVVWVTDHRVDMIGVVANRISRVLSKTRELLVVDLDRARGDYTPFLRPELGLVAHCFEVVSYKLVDGLDERER